MNHIQKFVAFVTTSVTLFSFSILPTVLAAESSSDIIGKAPGDFTNPPITTIQQLFDLLKDLTNWFLVFALIIGVVMIIVGGVMYITAGGSTDKAKTASKLIAFAAIGIAIVALAWGIVQVVANLVTQDSNVTDEVF
ncbi:MAG: hypothetical protein UY09_C0018G0005 [Parcubacteria group bacterium GW2011_GWA2_47_8]|nr:MAG: hypothetical protein UY09_C0018G0005 [Parcubacteria group bacterium GW2011_GWA2_47_8]OHB20516.1 MAG: hypothetical protein A2666_03560 [Parcubacteria group bacterium RIFCSPHIGHO2_01_FULL_47_10b]